MGSISVLIVDYSPYIRASIRSILEAHADVEVVGDVSDGQSAISMAERLRPNVILVDAQMPGMDGVEVTRRIKFVVPESKLLILS